MKDEVDKQRVRQLLDELLDSDAIPEEVCASCPELLPEVRARWEKICRLRGGLDALFPSSQQQGASSPVTPPDGKLPQIPGYEVERELGRGGMGIVYRARQLRLNRRVALKMLLTGSAARPEDRERFRREAEAIAALHHPNIVQLYEVGDVDGRPYFTMELVEGSSLADYIHGATQPTAVAAALVATLADAIHAAHQSGIVHRDLKPGNILLQQKDEGGRMQDEKNQNHPSDSSFILHPSSFIPKITDFGLARRLEGNAGPTLSGAPLGTPSYMAPEQARGDKQAIGPATDVYAMGAILYEMLTGRPPFCADVPAATLQQILTDEPVSPGRLNAKVPRDLTTICLKCLSKEPSRRYSSAAALAEDLRRFVRREPIAARRSMPLERLARWARRRPSSAALLIGTLLVTGMLLGAGGWLIRERVLTEQAVEEELQEAERLQQQSAFPEAAAALERAQSRLGDGGPAWLYPVLESARRDHQFLVRLEAIRTNRLTLVQGREHHAAMTRMNTVQADRDYAATFRDQGLGEPPHDVEEAAARVRASKWAAHIVAALDDWAVCAAEPARQDWLLEVARRADPDPWRNRVRDGAAWRNGTALAELARAAPLAEQTLPLLLAVGQRLSAAGEDGVGFLRRVWERHPEDFWANFTLALALHDAGRRPGGDPATALVYYKKALEIRPQAVAVFNDLGLVLLDRYWMHDNEGEWGPGAVTVFHQLVQKHSRFAPGFNNLGLAYKVRGDWSPAVLAYHDALRIDPRLAPAHFNLAEIRAGSGQFDEAIGHYRQALEVFPDFAAAHHLLGIALLAKGQRDEVDEYYPEGVKPLDEARGNALNKALASYWQAMSCDPAWAVARNTLRIPRQDEARLKEALGHYREAVRIDPQLAVFHGALGQVLLARREFAEAEAQTRRALDLLPEGEKSLRANLDCQLQRCQRLRALEDRLAAIVQENDKPAAADCLDLAELCFVKNHYRSAARLYAEAFAATPRLTEDLRAGHRFNAARAAALAGGGHGDDVAGFPKQELERLRKQARDWLRLDLAAWSKKLDTGTPAERVDAQKTLSAWRDDPNLAELRDADTLKRLPAPEQQECQALWQEVEALLSRAKG
jgi:serine/threonine-protein kinase